MRSILSFLILSGLILACSACGRDVPTSQNHDLEAVATYSLPGGMARQVGSEHVSVRTLVGPDDVFAANQVRSGARERRRHAPPAHRQASDSGRCCQEVSR